MNHTIKLLKQIGTPFEPNKIWDEPEESEEIYKYAFKNRVGLLYLLQLKKFARLDRLNPEYKKLDYRAKETMVTAARAGKILKDSGIDYLIFKTIRPYPATPNDVDIICLCGEFDYRNAIDALYKAGYFTFDNGAPMQVLFSDPRGKGIASWDKKGGIYYVDLYKAPAADYFVYLDPEKLKAHVIETKLNGQVVKILRPEVELAAILMHSVFPEITFTLEVFYTTTYSLSRFSKEQIERFISFSKKSHLFFPIRVCLSITASLHENVFGYVPEVISNVLHKIGGKYHREVDSFTSKKFKTPYKFLSSSFFITFLHKLKEPSSLKSLGIQGIHMLNPMFLKDFIFSLYKHLSKGTYKQT